MADPNAKRDRALSDIADHMKAQVRILETLNKNVVAIGQACVPTTEAITSYFDRAYFAPPEGMMVSSGTMEGDVDPKIDEKTEFISVIVDELSYREVQEAGYVLHNTEHVGSYIRVPRLRKKEESSGS